MKLKNFLYRLAAILTAFALGVGFFNAAQYLQTFFQEPEIETVETVVKRETLIFPPRVEPASLIEAKLYAQPEPIADSKEEREVKFSADGVYDIIGNLPKEFKDYISLDITTRSYEDVAAENRYVGDPIPPEGSLSTSEKSSKDVTFDFKRINIADKQIAFETETKKGVSYKFVGEFINEEKIEYKTAKGYEQTQYAVLKGRLTKWRDGKKIADIEAYFSEGGC
jgi:hypothetical protein